MQRLLHPHEHRLAEGPADQVLLDQGGPVVGADLAEDDQLGPLAGVAGVRGGQRHQEQEVGEGEVGQHRPRPEEALEVLELVGRQVGVLVGQLGRGGHLEDGADPLAGAPAAGAPSPVPSPVAAPTGTVWGTRRR